MAWRLERDLPAPYSEILKVGMVFIDEEIPAVKQFKNSHFFQIGTSEYIAEIMPVIYNQPPGAIRDHYLDSFVQAIKRI